MIIGVDLDNTLAGYGELFLETAVEMGLMPPGLPPDKTRIRDRVRRDHGDEVWQRIQARVYGPEMHRARLRPEAEAFLDQCRRRAITVHVISHKTRFARLDESNTDLRKAALAWMRAVGLFDPEGPDLSPERVHFENTRLGKVERIRGLGCTDFVDDLEEVFRESTFPSGVRAFLFGQTGTDLPGVTPCPDWNAVTCALFSRGPADNFDYDGVFGIKVRHRGSLPGGANSRVTTLTLEDGTRLVAKHYHRHPDDPRDRMGAEVDALRLLRGAGLDCVPEVLAADRETGTALFSLVRGVPVNPPYRDSDLDQLVLFLGSLRRLSDKAGTTYRPVNRASEACFDLDELEANLSGRLERLRRAPVRSACHQSMLGFLDEELEPLVRKALDAARDGAAAEPVRPGHRLLSPSDLGFHNALRLPDGRLAFLDMEYFGWDDPAKTLCDVLLHPAMALGEEHKTHFLRGALNLLDPNGHGPKGLLAGRVAGLYPLYGAKWCLILLNEFVAADLQRRRLAGGCADLEVSCAQQLAKARTLYQRLDDDHARVRAYLA